MPALCGPGFAFHVQYWSALRTHHREAAKHVPEDPIPGLRCLREAPLQWKVKRQSDGNRLSTQDPAQTRLLRKRGRIILEKHVAMTVDNKRDTELRTGRYRSRGQRKRHLVQEALQEEVLMRTATGEDRKNQDIVKADTGQLYPL